MTSERLKNPQASVRQRLLSLSQERGEDFGYTLRSFARERFLYRLSQSAYAERFVLKGATLFLLWGGEVYRPTWDVDFLGYGSFCEQEMGRLIQDVCRQPVAPDGVEFDAGSVRVEQIREEEEYGGLRVKLVSMLSGASVTLQIDVGFGDAITPKAEEREYPALLGHPAPRIRTYPRETVVAEKLHTIVVRGMANSQMRDLYDIRMIARQFPFHGPTLVAAIRATF